MSVLTSIMATMLCFQTVGPYHYTQDLLQIDSMHSPFSDTTELLMAPPPVAHFIKNWERFLQAHPDKQFKEYICPASKRVSKWAFHDHSLCPL